jgi:TolA-binding protein
MKKLNFIALVLGLSLVICGCSNDQYAVEKEYWQVKKLAESIFRNPAATPPNELERVVKQLESFIARNPKNILAVESEFAIAGLYGIKEEFDASRKQLKSIMKKYEGSARYCSEALFLIGNSYQAQNKWESALEQYKKVISDYPLTVRGLETPVFIAQYYKAKVQPNKMLSALEEAIDHYRALANKYPDSPLAYKAYTLISSCYSASKDWQNAIKTLNTITDKFQGKVRMDNILFDLILLNKKELKNATKAQEALDRLIKEYPDSRFIKPAKAFLKS